MEKVIAPMCFTVQHSCKHGDTKYRRVKPSQFCHDSERAAERDRKSFKKPPFPWLANIKHSIYFLCIVSRLVPFNGQNIKALVRQQTISHMKAMGLRIPKMYDTWVSGVWGTTAAS